MNEAEFQFLLKQGEGLRSEFKESFDSKNLAKEIVAFANSEGGRIFVGVTDAGEVKGVKITNKLKSEIQDIARNCDPSIEVEFEAFNNVLIVDVKEGLNKPYRCSAGFFLRQNSNSQKLSTDEIREFFNKEGRILFDEIANSEFDLKRDFDNSKFNIFLQKSKISRVISDKEILKNLGVLTENEKFKNAGVLFFCRNIEKFFRQAIITCVLYKGTDKYKILDRKDFSEDILSNYSNVMSFLLRNLKLEYKIETVGPREEILEIPEEALREAVVNAIVHRDYNEKGASIQINVFDDRVEMSNPGGLVSSIKKEEFGKKSITRNPLLFSLLKNVNLVEKVGSGIERMRITMTRAGLPPPKFESTSFFSVIFQRPSTPQKTTQKTPQKTTQKILDAVRENKYISRRELAEKVGITESGIKFQINNLKKKGLLQRIGPDKGGYWEVK